MSVTTKVNLTKIHFEMGGENKSKPSLFKRLLPNNCDEIKTVSGRYNGGTFASERVAGLYVKWINGGVDRSFRSLMDKEDAALSAIEQVLMIKLRRQYVVGDYRIDGYDQENNVAYEVDEGHHKTTANYAKDKRRESKIKDMIGCRFVRVAV